MHRSALPVPLSAMGSAGKVSVSQERCQTVLAKIPGLDQTTRAKLTEILTARSSEHSSSTRVISEFVDFVERFLKSNSKDDMMKELSTKMTQTLQITGGTKVPVSKAASGEKIFSYSPVVTLLYNLSEALGVMRGLEKVTTLRPDDRSALTKLLIARNCAANQPNGTVDTSVRDLMFFVDTFLTAEKTPELIRDCHARLEAVDRMVTSGTPPSSEEGRLMAVLRTSLLGGKYANQTTGGVHPTAVDATEAEGGASAMAEVHGAVGDGIDLANIGFDFGQVAQGVAEAAGAVGQVGGHIVGGVAELLGPSSDIAGRSLESSGNSSSSSAESGGGSAC
ncbi:hypothetical protein EBR96_00525 [bacterium]|nr:hypothetical protein [bacterium]